MEPNLNPQTEDTPKTFEELDRIVRDKTGKLLIQPVNYPDLPKDLQTEWIRRKWNEMQKEWANLEEMQRQQFMAPVLAEIGGFRPTTVPRVAERKSKQPDPTLTFSPVTTTEQQTPKEPGHVEEQPHAQPEVVSTPEIEQENPAPIAETQKINPIQGLRQKGVQVAYDSQFSPGGASPEELKLAQLVLDAVEMTESSVVDGLNKVTLDAKESQGWLQPDITYTRPLQGQNKFDLFIPKTKLVDPKSLADFITSATATMKNKPGEQTICFSNYKKNAELAPSPEIIAEPVPEPAPEPVSTPASEPEQTGEPSTPEEFKKTQQEAMPILANQDSSGDTADILGFRESLRLHSQLFKEEMEKIGIEILDEPIATMGDGSRDPNLAWKNAGKVLEVTKNTFNSLDSEELTKTGVKKISFDISNPESRFDTREGCLYIGYKPVWVNELRNFILTANKHGQQAERPVVYWSELTTEPIPEPIPTPVVEPEQTGEPSTPEGPTPAPVVEQKIKEPSAWAKLNNFFSDRGIGVGVNEEQLGGFEQTKSKEEAEAKYKEIDEAIWSFSRIFNLKEKFSGVYLVYSKDTPQHKIFITDNTLFIDLDIEKQEIIDFLNNLFNPANVNDQNPEPTEPTTPEQPMSAPAELLGKDGQPIKIGGGISSEVNGLNVNGTLVGIEGDKGVINVGGNNTVLAPLDTIVAGQTIDTKAIKPQEEIPEWKKGEEWKKFEEMREDSARMEARQRGAGLVGLGAEIGKSEYFNYKEEVAKQIKESLTKSAGENLTAEQQKVLDQKIHDTINEELLEKESEIYTDELKQRRSETLKDAVIEKLKSAASTRGVKWYRGLGVKKRLALNFLVGTTVGVAAGAAASIGVGAYAAVRGARTLSGLAFGAGAYEAVGKVKMLSIDQINAEEKEKLDNLKNDQTLSLEDKSRKFEEITKEYNKKRVVAKSVALGAAAIAGIGGSMLAGAMGENVAHRVLDNKIPRGRFEPTPHKITVASSPEMVIPKPTEIKTPEALIHSDLTPKPEYVPSEIDTPKVLTHSDLEAAMPEATDEYKVSAPKIDKLSEQEIPNTPRASVSETPENTTKEVVAPEPQVVNENALKELFPDPSVVKQNIGEGGSLWKALSNTLEHNDRFNNLSGTGTAKQIADQIEAKQTNVLQTLVSEVLKNHDQYGVGPSGEVGVGQQVDFSKLFSDPKHFAGIINDADDIKPGQVASTVLTNRKIEGWVEDNPGKPVNVDEILNTKPKLLVKIVDRIRRGYQPEYQPGEIKTPEVLTHSDLTPKPEYIPSEIKTGVLTHPDLEPKMPEEADVADLETARTNEPAETVDPGLKAAKERLQELEETRRTIDEKILNHKKVPVPPPLTAQMEDFKNPQPEPVRSMMGDLKKAIEVNQGEFMQNFRKEIHNAYGSDGVFGIGKTNGVDTAEWRFMSRLPASEVVKYYTKDSMGANLSPDILEELSKSSKHTQFWAQTKSLINQIDKLVGNNEITRPNLRENMEEYFTRLGKFVMANTPLPTNK